jgi:hypothetical protein
MKKMIKFVAVAAFLMVLPLAMSAQTPPHPGDGNGGAPGPGDPPVGAPIDGGLSIMLVLGAAYGAKKAFKFGK